MRRVLCAIAVALVVFLCAEWLAYLVLKYEFNQGSFWVGCTTCMIMYIVLEIILGIKDKIKNGAIANIKITVKDANDPEQVADAISMGVKTFNNFRKLGESTMDRLTKDDDSEDDSDDSGSSTVYPN